MGKDKLPHSTSSKSAWQASRLLPWMLAVGSLAVAATALIIEAVSGDTWPVGWTAGLGLMLFVASLGFGYLAAIYIIQLFSDRRELTDRLRKAEEQNTKTLNRLEAVFQIHKKFIETTDETEIIDLALRSAVDLAGASSALYVPLDERGQPLTAVPYGQQPYPVPDIWAEYLASPSVRERCSACEKGHPLSESCPLISGPFQGIVGMFCLPLKRGDREYGVLNLHLPGAEEYDIETQEFLRALADQTAIAIEGHRMRQRELQTLRQLQAVRDRTDLRGQLNDLLENARQVLEADFVMLYIQADSMRVHSSEPANNTKAEIIFGGETHETVRQFLDGFIQGVLNSQEPIILGNVVGELSGKKRINTGTTVRAVIAAPLSTEPQVPLGVLLAGSYKSEHFNPRQAPVLQSIAGQIVLALQTANHIADAQYQSMMDERTRLAREIHDGLAQTLGFLKLQMSQTQGYLERGEIERSRNSMRLVYQTLAEAYLEARFAIDGLRISPDQKGYAWVEQILLEFNDNTAGSGLEARLCENSVETFIPPEVQAQLIRILQEALSNVRKHSEANHVLISFSQEQHDIVLQIQDDGRGFSSDEVSGPSRHGLRGMRERADLIGADFQVISKPSEGTIVKVSLPVQQEEFEK